MQLSGSTILITGASSGIGAATARHLATRGMALGLCGRDRGRLEDVQRACEGAGAAAVATFPGDITDLEYVRELPGRMVDAHGRLDALFNNAGVAQNRSAATADLAEWDRILDVNFRSWMHLTREALPHLMSREESAVINLCSVSGRTFYEGGAIYCATKHAVHGWAQCMFEDVRARGVRVSTLYPGYVDTPMVSTVSGDHGHMIQPEDIAETVEFVLRYPTTSCPTEIVIRPQRPVKA